MGQNQTLQLAQRENSQSSQNSPSIVTSNASQEVQDQIQEKQAYEIQNNSIRLPKLSIQQTPFKKYNSNLQQSILTKNFYTSKRKSSWLQVIYHPTLFERILDYLPYQDDENIMFTNKRLYSDIFMQRIKRQHHWEFILWKIRNSSKVSVYDIISQNQEQSEHSMDLDRTESFFQPDQDLESQITKLDRVMRALSASIPYFQGMNSIVATLLSFFDEHEAFSIAKMLVFQCQNIQNDCQKYIQFINDIEAQVKKRIPRVNQILQQQDLNIQYFVMKWVLGIFSYDLERQALFVLYSMISMFGLSTLKWFIIAILSNLQQELQKISNSQDGIDIRVGTNILLNQQSKGDNINVLLKQKLKLIFVSENFNNVIQQTKKLLVQAKYQNSKFRSEYSYCSSNGKQGHFNQQKLFALDSPCPGNLWYQKLDQSLIFQNTESPIKCSPVLLKKHNNQQEHISEFECENCNIMNSFFGIIPDKMKIEPTDYEVVEIKCKNMNKMQ